MKIGYLSQDLFRANDEHTVEEEMKTCFPDIKLAMERLEEIEKLLNGIERKMEKNINEIFPLFKEGGPLAVGDFKNPHPDLSGSSFKKEQKMDSSLHSE